MCEKETKKKRKREGASASVSLEMGSKEWKSEEAVTRPISLFYLEKIKKRPILMNLGSYFVVHIRGLAKWPELACLGN